jgi:hypothetical protein
MPLTRPVVGTDISAADFGQPVYDRIVPGPWIPYPPANFLNGWTNYDGPTGGRALSYRKEGTSIRWRGVLKTPGGGTVSAVSTIGMLSADAYADGAPAFPVASQSNPVNIEVAQGTGLSCAATPQAPAILYLFMDSLFYPARTI